ncbi:Phosphoglucosamine mutase [Candidatus Trichorickettsia mobilis]|uniref:Phosphoglucosamine mutase n=1 Tax=Candidatus Trichorickettsia mobilis TaxID=1346319 RepID=A0ABZ0URX7_9RICK|nr:phosphoglucosamine mutase [Candidatus Trichorickettsia mobilis]WPY00797.1 Phosphoglucosamine mutase [Candidatus Trichorickettsia mobilis]
MQKKYFGTDGIRGRSNTNIITPEIMIKLAMATAVACGFSEKRSTKPTIVIGKDTRLSGYMLEFALTSGFISMGVNIVLVGPIPTPAISMLIRSLRADLGMMISASHNPYYDNGVKFFDSSGYKMDAALENKIEQLMSTDLSEYVAHYNDLGKAVKLEDARGRYIEHVKYSFPHIHKLDGIKIVVDCANGAAYDVAPKVFHELGAEVIACGINPNGFNINHQCGVLDAKELAKKVVEHKADLGIALDGDADRILIIDENGQAIDGDQIIAALADYLSAMNHGLKNNTVVTTIMSNMGLELYLNSIGISLVRTNVGDKHVAQKMRELECNLGGEQSGHIIIGANEATGDGIKVALQVLAMYKIAQNIPISQLLNKFTPVPQFTHNIYYDHKYYGQQNLICKDRIENITRLYQKIYAKEARIIIRKSGTEPIIRLMVESIDSALAKNLLSNIRIEVEKELNLD